MHYVYMIKNSEGLLYVGVSEDLNKRMHYHNTNQGAEFTKNQNSFHLVFSEGYETLEEARKREVQIKKWRRDKKELLIQRYSERLQTKPE